METRPNIILILADQWRADCLGSEGKFDIDTPNLDYLASRGSRFRHAYSAVPSCIPARASLMTGMDQWRTGILGMGGGQPQMRSDYPYTLAGEFTRAGYQTHLSGKGHFSPPDCKMGFETIALDESGRHEIVGREDDYRRWFRRHAPEGVTPDSHGVGRNSWMARPWHTEEYLHPTAWTMMDALNFLKHRDHERPFFLNISFARPHSPYLPPEYYFHSYAGRVGQPVVGEWAAGHDVPDDALDPNAWQGRQSERNNRLARMGYFGDISFIDAQIGRLLHHLPRLHPASAERTWLVFASDHGDMLGDHNLWRKTYAYEGSARIPLIICPPLGPDRPTRRVVDEVVELRDLMPTLLEAAGLPIPHTVTGQSLLPCLHKQPEHWRKYIHGEHSTCYSPAQEMQYVTDGRRKLIWFPRTGIRQFFDLERDPSECVDLIGSPEYSDEIQVWQGRLIQELQNRNCGWCAEGTLHAVDGPLISPYSTRRF